MNALGTRIALVALASALASASPAFGQEPSGELLPPGNSAANQYTEAFPTARGGQDPEQDEGKPRKGSSLKALGARNVRRLEAEGPEGRAAARLAAETAPATVEVEDDVDSSSQATPEEPRRRDAKPATDDKPHHKKKAKQPAEKTETTAVVVANTDVDPPSGASGFGEVIGQATGASATGGLGLWLPLLIVGVLGWAGGFAWSRHGTARQPG